MKSVLKIIQKGLTKNHTHVLQVRGIVNEEVINISRYQKLINVPNGITGRSTIIETTKGKKILFDFGADPEVLKHNSRLLGIELGEVDVAVISHLHFGSSGGIEFFCKENQKAPILVSEKFLETEGQYYIMDNDHPHFKGLEECDVGDCSTVKCIGATNLTAFADRLTFLPHTTTPEVIEFDEDISFVTTFHHNHKLPKGSHKLKAKDPTVFSNEVHSVVDDDFSHEIVMVLHGEKNCLFTGCSHNGIANILDTVTNDLGIDIEYVFGGFYLQYEDNDLQTVSKDLMKFNTKAFYTNSSTGYDQAQEMQTYLPKKLYYLRAGEGITLAEFSDDPIEGEVPSGFMNIHAKDKML